MPLNRLISAALLGSLLLAGCGTAGKPAESAAPVVQGMRCNAEPLQALVGKTASRALVDQAHRQSGAQTVRVLAPHDGVTLEYDAQRLNIDVDDGRVIRSLHCG